MSEPAMGPLAQMMIDNGEMIEATIEAEGASAVAEFFVNVGTGIAMLYETTKVDPDGVASIPEGTE